MDQKQRGRSLDVEWTDAEWELEAELARALASAVAVAAARVGGDGDEADSGSGTMPLELRLGLVPCVVRARFTVVKSGRLGCSVEIGVRGADFPRPAGNFDIAKSWVFSVTWDEILEGHPSQAASYFSPAFGDVCESLAMAEHFQAERARHFALHEAQELAQAVPREQSVESGATRL